MPGHSNPQNVPVTFVKLIFIEFSDLDTAYVLGYL